MKLIFHSRQQCPTQLPSIVQTREERSNNKMENVTLVAMDNKLPSASSSGAGGYMRGAPTPDPDLPRKLLAAGVAACVGDLVTFPLDVAKVRLQVGPASSRAKRCGRIFIALSVVI